MKIQHLLVKDKFSFMSEGLFSNDDDDDTVDSSNVTPFKAPPVSIADLSSLQLRTLKRLHDGTVTLDNASDSELERIMDLEADGIIKIDDDGKITITASLDDTSSNSAPVAGANTPDPEHSDGSVDDDADDDFEDDNSSIYGRRNTQDDIDFNI